MASQAGRYAGHDDRLCRCGNYNAYATQGCTPHSIWEIQLRDIVLTDIRACAKAALSDENAVLETFVKRNTESGTACQKSAEKEIHAAENRLNVLDRIFSKLYEDRVLNAITESNYKKMLSRCQQEQQQLQKKLRR